MKGIHAKAAYLPDEFAVIMVATFDYVRAVQQDSIVSMKKADSDSVLDMYFKQEHINIRVSHKVTMEMLTGPGSKDVVKYILEDMYRKAHPDDDKVDKGIFEELLSKMELELLHLGYDPKPFKFASGGIIKGDKYAVANAMGIPLANPVKNLTSACGALDEVVPYPKGTRLEGHEDRLFQVIQVLNDADKWTREQIADWLESLDIDLSVEIKE